MSSVDIHSLAHSSSYPSVCVKADSLVLHTRKKEICEHFVTDIKRCLKSVCGMKVHLQDSAWRPVSCLNTALDKKLDKCQVRLVVLIVIHLG